MNSKFDHFFTKKYQAVNFFFFFFIYYEVKTEISNEIATVKKRQPRETSPVKEVTGKDLSDNNENKR